MNNGEGKESTSDSGSFVGKFEAILHTLFEEYGKKSSRPKSLSEDQKNIARCLQELVSTGELKIDNAASETTSLCDGFIGDWESTGIKSAAVQQLIALLNRPHVRNTRGVNASLPRGSSGQSKRTSITRMFSDAEIQQIIDGGTMLYKQYGHLFDATITNKDLEESTTQLIHLINELETKPSWVPLSWATNLCSE
ncbi:hypothetical protein NECAME_05902 [Necator americanus]|uniref:Guanylate kinase-like domain-containing protein n=1 Tax=Necator americanus TaxID=51031 RepID=W2TXK2_NECAM|nr:hypothetical protein NECAME_05902 [Necator americanus]ETN86598.1 hypothetical protein NECAME_05902 [Necator americanus]